MKNSDSSPLHGEFFYRRCKAKKFNLLFFFYIIFAIILCMDKFISPFRQSKTLNVIFLSNTLLSFHYYLIVYINSTFLNQYFSETQISALYVIGSILNIFLFLNAAKILNTLSNYKTTLYAITFETLATLGLCLASNPFLIGLYFVIHTVIVAFIAFNLDVFLEGAVADETKT